MDVQTLGRAVAFFVKAFFRSQWIAAPIGLLLASMDYISPTRNPLGFDSAALLAWCVATPVAFLFCLAAGS